MVLVLTHKKYAASRLIHSIKRPPLHGGSQQMLMCLYYNELIGYILGVAMGHIIAMGSW